MLQFHGVLEHFARALCTQSENVLMLKLRDTQRAKHWTTIVWRCLCAKTNTSLAFFCKRYNVSRTLLLCTYRLSCHSLSIPAIEQIWSHCWNKIRAVFYLIMIKNNKICVVALMHVVCYIYVFVRIVSHDVCFHGVRRRQHTLQCGNVSIFRSWTCQGCVRAVCFSMVLGVSENVATIIWGAKGL